MPRVELSEENVRRLAKVAALVEGWPQNDAVNPVVTRTAAAHVGLIQVTSTTQTSGWYPCQWQTFDPDTLAKANGGTQAGWARGPNDEALEKNVYYLALHVGDRQADSNACWLTCSAGSGVALVKIANGTPQGDGTFDGVLQVLDPSGPSVSAGVSVWLWDPNVPGELRTGDLFLALYGGVHSGRPLYVRDDFDLTVVDNYNNVTYNRIRKVIFDSTPSAYNPAFGDFVFSLDTTGRELTVRVNGDTVTASWCLTDGIVHAFAFNNGILKTITP